MKKLTDVLVSTILAQNAATESLENLGNSIQMSEDSITVGTGKSYIEINDTGLNLVSGGKSVSFSELLEALDYIAAARAQSTGGTDEDELELTDPDIGARPLPEDEGVLEDGDNLIHPPSLIESTVIEEKTSAGSLPGVEGWNQRNLNTENNNVNWAVLTDGGFRLDPGSYNLIARTPALLPDFHVTRLRSQDGRVWQGCLSQATVDPVGGQAIGLDSFVFASLAIAESTVFYIDTYIGVAFRFGALGAPGSAGDAPDLDKNFIYSQVMITRLS